MQKQRPHSVSVSIVGFILLSCIIQIASVHIGFHPLDPCVVGRFGLNQNQLTIKCLVKVSKNKYYNTCLWKVANH